MKILNDILHEHRTIKEDISKLPKVGNVIEISKRDTSNRGGAKKKTVGNYEILSIISKNRMLLTKNVKTNVKECFTFHDLLNAQTIVWEELSL